jgi:hypothetical protein
MDELITLELKQKNSGNVVNNGDFKSILSTPVEINEGDEINISKVFIDSVNETQSSVVIPEDLNFTFSANIYNVNWNIDGKTYFGQAIPDCKKYILCNKTATTTEIKGILYVSLFIGSPDPYGGSSGGVSTTWEYRDLNGTPAQFHLYIPIREVSPSGTPDQILPIGVITPDNNEGYFRLVSPSLDVLRNEYNVFFPEQPVTKRIDEIIDIYTPIAFEKTILVRQGNYDPIFFAKLITDNLTINDRNAENEAPEYSAVQNPFLISTNDWGETSGDYYFVDSETGLNAFTYNPIAPDVRAGGFWVGTNQMSLEFANNRFYWSNLHFPMYDGGSGGAKTITYIDPTLGSGVSAIPVGANSGLIWNSIKTDSKDPRYVNFFNSVLGFNAGLTTAVPQMLLRTVGGTEAYAPIYNWNKNNFTQGLNSIDVGVIKVNPQFYKPQSCLTQITIINDETQGIYANDIFSQVDFQFGYYQIALETNFKNMLIGTEIKRNITALISRYYENNNYCSGNISDAITYIHKGAPVLLSSIGVRILNGDGIVVSGLGADNSVYIQVKKAPQQLLPPTKK